MRYPAPQAAPDQPTVSAIIVNKAARDSTHENVRGRGGGGGGISNFHGIEFYSLMLLSPMDTVIDLRPLAPGGGGGAFALLKW